MYGPTRTQIQRGRSGPAPIIGPAPRSSPEPTSASYKAAKAAKLERDRQVNLAKEQRPRSAGPMKPRSRGDSIRNGNGNGNGGSYNGGSYPVAAPESAPPAPVAWWMNPLYWAALVGLYLVTRKGKK